MEDAALEEMRAKKVERDPPFPKNKENKEQIIMNV